MKTFAIIGTGAIGGYCAIKLQQAGFDIHCLLGSDYLHVKQHGLTLIFQGETVTLPVHAYKNENEMPTCDVLIISLKSTSNAILKHMLPQIMHEKSVVVVLQNGIGVENDVAQFIMNGLSVVLDASSKELVENPASYSLLLSITREVIDTAKKCGAEIPNDFYQFRLSVLENFKSMEKNNTSMKDDFNAKKPMELNTIYKNAILLAAENHVTMPLTEMLYQQLVYLNEKNLISP